MKYQLGLRQIVLLIILVLVLGGIGGILLERVVLPYLSTLPGLKNLPLLSPRTPIIITKREEIRINEGVNNVEVASRIKNSLASVYFHQGEFGTSKFRLLGTAPGIIVTSDGVVATPAALVRPESLITIILTESQEPKVSKVLATDPLLGLAFLKIDSADLPVIKQGFSEGLEVGERILAIWPTAGTGEVLVKSVVVSQRALPLPSLLTTYDFSTLNATLQTDLSFTSRDLGASFVNRDAALVGILTQIGKNLLIVRAEELQLSLKNFLSLKRVAWPSLKMSYQILGASQAALLGLPQKYGILVKSAPASLRENDFVYAVDDRELTPTESFQDVLLAKKRGERVKLKLMRAQEEKEVDLSL